MGGGEKAKTGNEGKNVFQNIFAHDCRGVTRELIRGGGVYSYIRGLVVSSFSCTNLHRIDSIVSCLNKLTVHHS